MDTPHSSKSSSSQITVNFLRDRIRHDRDAGDLRPLADYLAVFSADETMVAQAYFAVCQESTPPPGSHDVTVQNRSVRTSMLAAGTGGPAQPLHGGVQGTGEYVGPYRLLKEIGRVGQGAVHLSEDTRLGRRVALKVLTGVGALTEGNLRRFHREAELASKLDHPGICAVYDYGAFESLPYIAMRFVEGETLAKRIANAKAPEVKADSEHIAIDDNQEPVTIADSTSDSQATTKVKTEEVIRIMEKASRAIHAAHEAGVIHRDLKPGNIMVDASGEPVVLDFGLARDLEGEFSLTKSGDFLGTPAYMSPEQIAAGHIHLDRRSDVYSLGVTLYECLTLRRPFDAPTREALYQAILSKEPPDPRLFNKSISSDLRVVLETALNKDRDKRYVSAEAFANDLKRVIELKPILAKPISPLGRVIRWARRNPGIAAATAVAFVSLAAGLIVTLIQKAEVTQHRASAEKSAKEATANLAEWTKLADARVLEDLVEEANTRLWPANMDHVPAMEAWLVRARDLATRLEPHRAALAAVRTQGKPRAVQPKDAVAARPESAPSTRQSWEFATTEAQFKHDTLATLVDELGRFAGDRRGDRPTIKEIEERLEFARTVRKRTVDDYAAVWRDTIAAVAKSPVYGGMQLKPQEGLIPIGPDPKSGLQEFTEIQMGEPVRRGEAGRIEIGEDSAMVFVLLPGGTFWQGAQRDDNEAHNQEVGARVDESPIQEVTLSPFFVSKFEMTQGQWERFTGKNPSQFFPGRKLGGKTVVDLSHPVEQVTWTACNEILERLGCLLPTEAQWEYAARAGAETPWFCGTDPTALQRYANLADLSFSTKSLGVGSSFKTEEWDDEYAGHAPVGAFESNKFGLHDILGNVFEWCRDGYLKEAYLTLKAQPGDGLRIGPPELRAMRGSSFAHRAENARSAYRGFSAPNVSTSAAGVRPARVVNQ